MGWELKDEDLLNRITASTAPPNDLPTLLSDDLWANAFSMWATDLGYQKGDYNAGKLHHLWIDLDYRTPGETIYAQYVDPSGPSALQWSSGVTDRFERVANGMESDYAGALAELRGAATEMLEPHASRFREDIHEIQSTHVSEPTPVGMKLEHIDMGTVDRINQAELKDLPEYRQAALDENPGAARVKFYATSSLVLIGDNHPASYYQYLTDHGYTVGTITMMRRGGAFSRGRVEVAINDQIRPGGESYGDVPIASQDDIRQAVTDAIGRVSKKEVEHRK
jgi:hypothetical protein